MTEPTAPPPAQPKARLTRIFLILGGVALIGLLWGALHDSSAPGDPSSAGEAGDSANEPDGNEPSRAVRIESDPAGASVFVSGRLVGATPLALDRLAPGRYGLRLEKAGREPLVGLLECTGKAQTARFELPPLAKGKLEVDIQPRGAEVLLNGELVGHAPLALDAVPVGQYELLIRKTNFEPFATRLEIHAGQTQRYHGFELRDKILGMLENMIRAEPQRVAHYIDLGHYQFVNLRMDEAVDAFMRGQEMAEKPLELPPDVDPEERGLQVRLRYEDRARLQKELDKHKRWTGPQTAEFRDKLQKAEEIYSRRNIVSWNWVELAANNLLENGQQAAAEQLYLQHLAKVPDGPHAVEAYMALLDVRLQQRNLSTAEESFAKILELAKTRPEQLINTGKLLQRFQNRVRFNDQAGLLELAEKAYRQAYDAAQAGLQRGEAALLLGNVLTTQKHPVEAIAYYKEAAANAPDAGERENREVRLAEALRQSERFAEAKALYEKLTQSESVSIREKAKTGLILVKMARTE